MSRSDGVAWPDQRWVARRRSRVNLGRAGQPAHKSWTGPSEFPNQVNNSLGFPGIFRGTLDVRARTITDEMALAAARELAACAVEMGLSEERIVPRMNEWAIYPRVAAATALAAGTHGVARLADAVRQSATTPGCTLLLSFGLVWTWGN